MEITVYHETTADGRILRYVRPYLGTDRNGRQIRPRKSFPDAATDEEALEAAQAWLPTQFPTAHLGIQNTLAAVLATYVATRERDGKSANTQKKYESYLNYVTGNVAAKAPTEVTSQDILSLQDELAAPRSEGGRAAKPSTVIGFHWFLSGAFRWMMLHGIVEANPVPGAGKPSPDYQEADVFAGRELERLEVALREECSKTSPATMADKVRLEAARAATIALHTGMRVGEICALRQRDINHALSCIYVNGTIIERREKKVYRQNRTKSHRRRSVAASADLMHFMDQIMVSHRRQSTVLHGPDAPLLAARRGWMRPSEVSKAFKQIMVDHGLEEGHTFHSLRHTHATQLLDSGTNIKIISERLGHSSPATTLNKYAHRLPGRDAQAADVFSEQHRI